MLSTTLYTGAALCAALGGFLAGRIGYTRTRDVPELSAAAKATLDRCIAGRERSDNAYLARCKDAEHSHNEYLRLSKRLCALESMRGRILELETPHAAHAAKKMAAVARAGLSA